MKNSISNLGTVLNKEMQKQINGGDCITMDFERQQSFRREGPCHPNSPFEYEI